MTISGDRIVASDQRPVRATVGTFKKFYNLKDKTIVPGVIESHDHLYMSSSQYNVTYAMPFFTPTLAAAMKKIRHAQPD